MLYSPLLLGRSAMCLARYCLGLPTSKDLFEEFIRDISDWEAPKRSEANDAQSNDRPVGQIRGR